MTCEVTIAKLEVRILKFWV